MNTQTKALFTERESTQYPGLFVRKYAKHVFYNNLWHTDPQLVESRGRVFNSNGDVVINPFTKVFNYGENDTTIDDDEQCVAITKINGFMAAATWVPEVNDVVVSTTGSLESDYVKMAREMMPWAIDSIRTKHCDGTLTPTTYLFEVCHPNDPHIIRENVGCYLIGARVVYDMTPYSTTFERECLLDIVAGEMRVARPTFNTCSFAEVKQRARECRHEGFMVYGVDSGTTLKIKSPYYLASKAIARRADIETLDRSRVDEEFYGLLDAVRADANFNQLDEQQRLEWIRDYFYKENAQ